MDLQQTFVIILSFKEDLASMLLILFHETEKEGLQSIY